MIQESEIRGKIDALGPDPVSLMEFERWIGPASWNMQKDSDPLSVNMASEILFLFSQYGDGELSEAELRLELARVIRQ